MIRLRMSVADLERMRFAYSPLAEVAESLYLLSSGRVQPVHRGWYEATRDKFAGVDLALLLAVVPAHPNLAEFLFGGAVDAGTTIDRQLQALAACAPDRLRTDLEVVWRDRVFPASLEAVIREGSAGARRLADTLWDYWSVAIEPHWRQIRGVLDDDVAYRAARLTNGGIESLLADLHPLVSVEGISLDPAMERETDQRSPGLLLVPSVFAWPSIVIFPTGASREPSLTYGSRGVGTLWGDASGSSDEDDELDALIGGSRAAILTAVAIPTSTTELARELGQSPAAVSQHLAVLRRTGLVTSWRKGRSVLYQRTPLASSLISASTSSLKASSKYGA